MALSFKCVRKVIVTAGTPVELSASSFSCQRCDAFAPPANAGLVYLGRSDLSATARRSLPPGSSYGLGPVDASAIYVDGAVNGDAIEVVLYF